MQLSPLATGAVGVSATGAGAFITWIVGSWHGGIPEAAAGFLGAMLLALLHVAFVKIGAEPPDDVEAPTPTPTPATSEAPKP